MYKIKSLEQHQMVQCERVYSSSFTDIEFKNAGLHSM